jgi:hypothetical protein
MSQRFPEKAKSFTDNLSYHDGLSLSSVLAVTYLLDTRSARSLFVKRSANIAESGQILPTPRSTDKTVWLDFGIKVQSHITDFNNIRQ